MNWKTKRIIMLAASCIATLCAGSLYAWSVFAAPMAEHISQASGTQVSSLAIVFSVANALAPVAMIFGGFFNDKLGPKWVVFIGGLMFGTGMIASGFSASVPFIICTYGIFIGLSVGLIYGTLVSTTVKYFPDGSGFAGGLMTACYSGSSVIIPLIATFMLQYMHITAAFKTLGVIMMIIICGSIFVIDYFRRQISEAQLQEVTPAVIVTASAVRDYTYKEMVKTQEFYYMMAIMGCGSISGMMIIAQAASIAQGILNISPVLAATIVSLLAVANTAGRLSCGTISDKIGAVAALKLTFAGLFLASALLLLSNQDRSLLFYAGIILIGFGYGSLMGIYPGFSGNQFGRKHNSVNYGIIFLGLSMASLAGPIGMDIIYNATGRYQPAFMLTGVLSAVGFILIMLFQRKQLHNK